MQALSALVVVVCGGLLLLLVIGRQAWSGRHGDVERFRRGSGSSHYWSGGEARPHPSLGEASASIPVLHREFLQPVGCLQNFFDLIALAI